MSDEGNFTIHEWLVRIDTKLDSKLDKADLVPISKTVEGLDVRVSHLEEDKLRKQTIAEIDIQRTAEHHKRVDRRAAVFGTVGVLAGSVAGWFGIFGHPKG